MNGSEKLEKVAREYTIRVVGYGGIKIIKKGHYVKVHAGALRRLLNNLAFHLNTRVEEVEIL